MSGACALVAESADVLTPRGLANRPDRKDSSGVPTTGSIARPQRRGLRWYNPAEHMLGR